MENYRGYMVTRTNYDSEGSPTTVVVEKPNPNPNSNLPLDSKTVRVQDFLRELGELEEVVEGAKSIRKQIHSTTEARYRAKNPQ